MSKDPNIFDAMIEDIGKVIDVEDDANPIVKTVTDWANEVVACMQSKLGANINGKVKNNTGNLSQSISAREAPRKVTSARIEIVADADYAGEVNEGRRAGSWPPKQAIADWLRTKSFGAGERTDIAVYMISKKIFEKGVEPFPFWDECLNDAKVKELTRRLEAL